MRIKLYLEDEINRLGCGWRILDAHVGRKWVRLVDVANGKVAIVEKSVFERLTARPRNRLEQGGSAG